MKSIKSGMAFRARIEGVDVEGRINIQDDGIYFCQNEKNGSRCLQRYGYDYSWFVPNLTRVDLDGYCVSKLEIWDDVIPAPEVCPVEKQISKLGWKLDPCKGRCNEIEIGCTTVNVRQLERILKGYDVGISYYSVILSSKTRLEGNTVNLSKTLVNQLIKLAKS